MYSSEFKRILDASKSNSLTFFVGAGVSALSDAPKWSELIDSFCKEMKMPTKKYSSDEYLSIPQMYYYSIDKNKDKYYEFINNCFGQKQLSPNIIHKMMYDLSNIIKLRGASSFKRACPFFIQIFKIFQKRLDKC